MNLNILLVDIVASSPTGIFDSKIIKHIINLQNDFKPFVFFIRNWIIEIAEVRLKKMILLYLAIFFMQNINVLPSLNMVRSRLRKELVRGMSSSNFIYFK